jgi:hypothetical protein
LLSDDDRHPGQEERMGMGQPQDGAATRQRTDTDLQKDSPAGHPAEKPKKQLDKELDKALEDSFPASDPPSPSQPTGTEPAGDPKVKP